ncbi:MAG TPA: VCBS repeat-containing protein [Nitrospiria bacterium]|nr:VCBS repeat-containing protein [Nitrospiria bacterium]
MASIIVSPGSTPVPIYSTVQFSAAANDATGRACGSVTFTWSSSDSIKAPIDPASGLASTPYDGQPGDYPAIITITATDLASGLTGTATLTVNFSLFGQPTEYGLGVGLNPQALVIGQFNATTDGDPSLPLDVAVANQDSNTVSILLGDNTGSLTLAGAASTTSGSAPVALAKGRFDADTLIDLATANSGANDAAILLDNGDGSFTATSPATAGAGTLPKAVASGDFNGDGYDDLAVANYSSADITILKSNGDGTFTTSQTITPTGFIGPVSITAGDIDGDASLDLVVGDLTGDTVWVILGNGDGTFQTSGISPVAVPFPPGSGPASVVIGDFDGDGFADLAVVNQGTAGESCSAPIGSHDSVTILFGLGDGTFNPFGSPNKPPATYAVGSNPRAIAIGDFNNDGFQDLVTADYCSDDVSVLSGVGDGTFQPAVSFSTGMPGQDWPTGVAVGDLDNTGFDDLVITDSGTNSVSVLLNNY